ncbi:MAG: peptidyl-prolyl cis-trans isomerase [Sedimentisphaerales bacterium]|nr:peptidyl-prolyl cis-trans isomerase [Sedimentisphaerales bacterium]
MRNKWFMFIIPFFCCFILVQMVWGQTEADVSEELSGPITTGSVLKVNDDAVTSSEIVAMLPEQMRLRVAGVDREQFMQQAMPLIGDMTMSQVYNLLLYQHARAGLQKLKVPDEALDNIVQEKRKELIADYGGSEARAQEELAKQGFTIEERLDQARRQIVIDGYQQMHFNPTFTITRSQMLNYYRNHLEDQFQQRGQIQFQLIEIKKDAFDSPAQAAQEADSARHKLAQGADFADVVREFSQGFRKDQDGIWNPVNPESVRQKYQPVVRALNELEVGSTTGIIEGDESFFIAKLLDSQQEKVTPFSEAQHEIKKILQQQSWMDYRQRLGKDLLEKSSIGDIEQFVVATTSAAYDYLSRE